MKSKIVREFLDAIKGNIDMVSPSDAIALSRLYGNIAWNNPVGIFRADDIEDIVYAKVAKIRSEVLNQNHSVKNGKLLHVLTEGYTSGGHTRVVERLIGERPDNVQRQDIVIVEICPREVIDKLIKLSTLVRMVPQTGLKAIPVLAAIMAEYSDVVLHIHPDDIVSSLSARIAKDSGTRVALYNHADHCFTYGVCSINVLCEISAFGKKISNLHRPEIQASYVGIPLNIADPVSRIDSGNKTVLSSGPAYKFDLSDGGIFAAIIERVISELDLPVMLIGPRHLPADASPRLVGYVESGMLVITPPLDYAVYLEHVKKCLCYVDSAPVTGGSALPEASLAGVPCAGLANAIMGYSPVDIVRSSSVDELVRRIKAFRDGDTEDVVVSRVELVSVHRPATVLQRLFASVRGEQSFALPYRINEDALDIRYPEKQWLQDPFIHVHTRAFDFLPFWKRLMVLGLMIRMGVLRKINRLFALKLFVSNIATRRLRNR
jgi:hypothetical protein